MKHLLLAAGGRPGLRLLAPLYRSLKQHESIEPLALLGEALPAEVASCFDLEATLCPVPAEGSPAARLAAAMTAMEAVMLERRPEMVVVCGCDTSALAAALAASGLGLPVAAADAGLRSYDRQLADEVNRRLIDTVADLHFISEHSGEYNLISEGYDEESLFFVGNLAIDSLAAFMERQGGGAAGRLGLEAKRFALVRPSLVGGREDAERQLRIIGELASLTRVAVLSAESFIGHLAAHGLAGQFEALDGIVPVGEMAEGELLELLRDSLLLLAADTSLQAEATVMNVPCLTMLERTERPSTIETGTNVLVGEDEGELSARFGDLLAPVAEKEAKRRSLIPEKWDGAAASRMVSVLERML